MRALIITGGKVKAPLALPAADFVIAADSGYLTAKRLGVKPDLLLGDLDSLDRSQLSPHELDEMQKIIVSPIKDDTDTQLAADTAIARGADEIMIVGGLGGRLDHTLSSVFLLEYLAEKGIACAMTDGQSFVRILRGGQTLTVKKSGRKYLSLISLTDECRGVTISGVYYPLEKAELTRKYSWAVSNEITAQAAEISLSEGVMLVIEAGD
ncbi:MAG: thiamine diphosphokinase [Clostridia bacterium]|nr:thiamine diphosphokinase [Clostridia bacterium]